jgi:hypothetical protein
MPTGRILVVAGAFAAAVVLFLVLRPGDDADPAAGPGPATTQTGLAETAAGTGAEPEPETETAVETETATERETETEAEPDGVATLRVLVRGGIPEGGIQRLTVRRGETVRLVVRADVRDHVHLHGYDIMRDVGPGAPAQIVFQATVPGIFEAELEDRGLQVARIEVRP